MDPLLYIQNSSGQFGILYMLADENGDVSLSETTRCW